MSGALSPPKFLPDTTSPQETRHMDLLNTVPTENTITVTLVNPKSGEPLTNDGDDSDMTITFYAPHTKEYRAAGFNAAAKRLKDGDDSDEIDYAELEQSSYELLASITVDWNITFGGEVPKLTVEKAKEIYEKVHWIKPLVEKEFRKSEGFIIA